VLDPLDLDLGDGAALQAGQEDAAQAVSDRVANLSSTCSMWNAPYVSVHFLIGYIRPGWEGSRATPSGCRIALSPLQKRDWASSIAPAFDPPALAAVLSPSLSDGPNALVLVAQYAQGSVATQQPTIHFGVDRQRDIWTRAKRLTPPREVSVPSRSSHSGTGASLGPRGSRRPAFAGVSRGP